MNEGVKYFTTEIARTQVVIDGKLHTTITKIRDWFAGSYADTSEKIIECYTSTDPNNRDYLGQLVGHSAYGI